MKIFKVGDTVTLKDRYDPGCTGEDYPNLLPSSCLGAVGVVTGVCSDALAIQEKRKKMYNNDDYLYEVEIKSTNNPDFLEALRRARWHGSCFKEYDPDALLYKKGTQVTVKSVPGVPDWRKRYSPFGVIKDNVYMRNADDFAIIVKDLPDEDDTTTTFYVGSEDIEPFERIKKSHPVEEKLNTPSEIDDFLPISEKLDTPPEPQVSKKPIITVRIEEVKITIPKTVLPKIRI